MRELRGQMRKLRGSSKDPCEKQRGLMKDLCRGLTVVSWKTHVGSSGTMEDLYKEPCNTMED